MKKVIPVFIITLFLNFISIGADPKITSNILKQDVYNVNDIIKILGNIHTAQNISENESIYFILLDENESVVQTIKMAPNSPKYQLQKLEPNYKIILVGDGSVFVS